MNNTIWNILLWFSFYKRGSTIMKKYLSIDNNQIYVEEQGSGQAIIFLYTGLTSPLIWKKQLDYFAQAFRTIRIDLPGSGNSTVPKHRFSNISIIKTVLDALSIDNAVFVTSSISVNIVLSFAAEYPDKTKAMVFASPVLIGNKQPAQVRREHQTLMKMLTNGKTEDLFNYLETSRFWSAQVPHRHNREDYQIFTNAVKENAKYFTWDHEVASQYNKLNKNRIDKMNIPSLIIFGNREVTPIIASAIKIRTYIKNSFTHILQDTGHFNFLEKPAEFNSLLEFFLKNSVFQVPAPVLE
ncbi:MAG: alpha/beta fold hydrolase [Spirochaetia bacterium]